MLENIFSAQFLLLLYHQIELKLPIIGTFTFFKIKYNHV